MRPRDPLLSTTRPAAQTADAVRRTLADDAAVAAVEAALARRYLHDRGVATPPWLHPHLPAHHRSGAADAALRRRLGGGLALGDLVVAFESLVPADRAAADGVVFTPPPIAQFMAARGVDTPAAAPARVCDPAVGCGALLAAALPLLAARAGEAPSRAAARLTGVDTDADNVRRAGLLLALATLTLGDAAPPTPQLHVADSLRVDWAALTGTPRGFDLTIANPPYVRYQHLADRDRRDLPARYESATHGNFNLYYPFVELAADLTSSGGTAVLITPNAYLTSASGAPLRRLLADGVLAEVYDLGHRGRADAFPGALTYPAISVLRGDRAATHVAYRRADDLDQLAAPPPATHTPHTDLAARRWTLVAADEHATVDAMRRASPHTLADVAHIRAGVATLRDRLYVVHDNTDHAGDLTAYYQGAAYPIERDATRPVVKLSHHRDGRDGRDVADATHRLIFPYRPDGRGGHEVIPEDELRRHYPRTAAYLDAVRDDLARRDRGRKTYPAWYAYGRSQGLSTVGEKLLSPLYADRPRFLRAADPHLLHLNGVAVLPKPGCGVDVDALHAVLNSAFLHYWVAATSPAIDGGYHGYQRSRIADFPLPPLDGDTQQRLAAARRRSRDDVDTILAGCYRTPIPAPPAAHVRRRDGDTAAAAA